MPSHEDLRDTIIPSIHVILHHTKNHFPSFGARIAIKSFCLLIRHVFFFVTGPRPDVVLLTEASIAGGRSRSMPASSLKEIWMAAAQSQGISCYSDIGTITGVEAPIIASRPTTSRSLSGDKPMLIGCCTPFSSDLTRVASRLLQTQEDGDTGLICVTGSLHMVSSVLGQLRQ